MYHHNLEHRRCILLPQGYIHLPEKLLEVLQEELLQLIIFYGYLQNMLTRVYQRVPLTVILPVPSQLPETAAQTCYVWDKGYTACTHLLKLLPGYSP